MTVSTTTYFVIALGNGATTEFNFDFIADNADTMQVTYVDADLIETILDPSQYTLLISTPAVGSLWGIGGTVTYPLTGSPIATGTSLIIQRIEPYIQTVSVSNQGAFYPRAVEQGLDKLELQIQQLTGTVDTIGANAVRDKEIAFEWIGDTVPTESQVIALTSFPVEISFLENFAGATGHTLVNPTSTFVAGIYHNADHIGDMTVSTSGVFTFTTCEDCGPFIYEIDDYMTVVAPAIEDATMTNFAWTFKGVMN